MQQVMIPASLDQLWNDDRNLTRWTLIAKLQDSINQRTVKVPLRRRDLYQLRSAMPRRTRRFFYPFIPMLA